VGCQDAVGNGDHLAKERRTVWIGRTRFTWEMRSLS
jgi:hypothetical protein